MDIDDLLRCSWCGKRCRDRDELRAHHDEHRREDHAADIRRRLDRRCIPEPNTGCLLWTGSCDEDGLPYLSIEKRNYRARRLAWEQEFGPIDPDVLLVNRCGVRACIEPRHHFPGSYKDMHDQIAARGNTAKGERNGASILTVAAVLQIRSSSERQVDLAAKYGVGQTAIAAANTGQNWSHIK